MHRPVKENLEEYLKGRDGKFVRPVPAQMDAHLGSCADCANELRELELQSAALRSLRAPIGMEPRAGFYARVMQRIDEARAANSVWTAFLDPVFGKRVMYAAATLVLLLGAYLVSTEPGPAYQHPQTAVVAPVQSAATVSADDPDTTTPQERDAVLVNLASYQE